MITGEKAFALRGNCMRDIKKLKEELQNAKEKLHEYNLKIRDIELGYIDGNWNYEELHKLEKQIEIAEYNLYCERYEDNHRRNWK